MLLDKELLDEVILKRIHFSGEALKILLKEGRSLTKQQTLAICELLGVSFRVIRENESYNIITSDLIHGRINLEFDNGFLVDAIME